ncbi:hypothetical protein KSB_85320 [Ktedonobacter robiniae]|uniref:Uncharacterized protein n=1 Tax=Ktedonobacter robiniae TaxID=2778365 RepID=A0ABQ3V636_9CHLR|nr:hypothetical protein [Ktedonobacter robiniae]GHO60057.1 hypothetical protein KSB_85320 [Ktedonobacter robiniae]
MGEMVTSAKSQFLEIRWSRPLPDGAIPSSVTISKDCANRYFISILVEDEIEHLPCIETSILSGGF